MISGIPSSYPIDPSRYSRLADTAPSAGASATPEVSSTPSAPDSFGNVLGRLVNDVSAKQTEATSAVNALQSGQPVPLHQAVIAVEEANLSFQLMVEVRNRMLDSYQEIMRMQI